MQIGDQANPYSAKTIIGGGKIVVGTTPVAVSFSTQVKSIIITADRLNSGILYVGDSDVLSDGSNAMTYLESGDDITLDYDDVEKELYVVASIDNQYFWKGGAR